MLKNRTDTLPTPKKLNENSKFRISEKYKQVRQQTLDFCSHLQAEDYAVQVVKFASPAKWHLAHTTWFFETFILLPNVEGYTVFDPDFNYLFNSYYNNVGERILQSDRGNMSRPATDKILAYRQYVDEHLLSYLENLQNQGIKDLIILGLHHEQQHQELLVTDVKYMLGHHPLFPVFNENYHLVKDHNEAEGSVQIEEGIYDIGHKGHGFCYDNELGLHKRYLTDALIDKKLVTNGEYLEFMEAGSYSDFNLWLDDGWHWVNKNNIKAPLYWHQVEGEWHYYTLAGLKKIDKEAVLCHVNYYEACAFAEWKGKRLATEFEWEVAAPQLNWGKRWEWTNSAYLAYPNFKKAEGAVGEYNGKFMVNRMVLRGASTATPADHSRPSYRNFFTPAERWQFTGIRLAK